jgi:hypothetical protein
LQLGKRWSARFATDRQHGHFDEDMEARIVRRELVTVPAGVFDAFRIEATLSGIEPENRKRLSAIPRRMELVSWEVPGLNFPVKEEKTLHRRKGAVEHSAYELVSLRQEA